MATYITDLKTSAVQLTDLGGGVTLLTDINEIVPVITYGYLVDTAGNFVVDTDGNNIIYQMT